MAVQITKRGEDPKQKKYETTCRRCKTEFNFLPCDAIRLHPGDQRDGPFAQINCPVCSALCTAY